MRRGIPNLFKDGTKLRSGLHDAVLRNLEACKQLADLTRTSLGPSGLNKMLINHLDKIFVTSDTATLMAEMEIAHPAAKMVVMASGMQESEVGDGSNFVIVLAGELLHQAEELLHMGLHPSEIIAGYTKAAKQALSLIEQLSIEEVPQDKLTDLATLTRIVTAPIAAKQYGYESFLAQYLDHPHVVHQEVVRVARHDAQACLTVMPRNPYNFLVDNVRVVKILGGNLYQSEVVRGMVLAGGALGSVQQVERAKVAVFTCSIGAADTETKGTILIHNAAELMSYNDSEEREIEKVIKSIHDSGVRVIVTGSTVDDIAQHFLDKYQLMTIKTTSKFELRRICKATRARPLVALGPVRTEEVGYASQVYVREVGGSKVTVFKQEEGDASGVATILLRASTHNILNDIERAIDDGVNTVRALTRDNRLLAGAGAVDIELARQLHTFAQQAPGLEQYALAKFATAMEVVPRALANNAGMEAMDIVSQLYAQHEKGGSGVRVGVDIEARGVDDMATKAGVVDLMAVKRQAIRLAVDAVLTVLRVDSIIQAKQAGGPKMGGQQGNWDDED